MSPTQQKVVNAFEYARFVVAALSVFAAVGYVSTGNHNAFYLVLLAVTSWLVCTSALLLSSHLTSRHPGDSWIEADSIEYRQEYDGHTHTPSVIVRYSGDAATRWVDDYHERKNHDQS